MSVANANTDRFKQGARELREVYTTVANLFWKIIFKCLD